MMRYESVTAEVIQETARDHVARVGAGALAGQIVGQYLAEAQAGPLGIHHFQKLLAGQRQLRVVEPAALNHGLRARDGRQSQRERAGRFQKQSPVKRDSIAAHIRLKLKVAWLRRAPALSTLAAALLTFQ